MPTFDTPEPISVEVVLEAGDVSITAGDRADTVVEVRPSDAGRAADVAAAEQAVVDYSGGRLTITGPKSWRRYMPMSDIGSVDVRVDLPAGSDVQGDAGAAAFHCAGRLGECRIKTGVGEIQIGEAGQASLRTGAGDVIVGRAGGGLDASTGTGAVRVREVGGAATAKTSNGEIWVGEAAGDLRARTANGAIRVERAHAGVAAKTAAGRIRLGSVERGEIVAETGAGELEIGIAEGAAAWLDVHTKFGHVRNELDQAGPPPAGEASVEVRARTSFGDIVIRRP